MPIQYLPHDLDLHDQTDIVTLFGICVAVWQQEMEHHLADFFSYEGEGPFEDVHEVWKGVRVLDLGVLLED